MHGIQDFIVPFEHSIEMLLLGFKNCRAHMFLQENMEHNKFNYSNDIVRPLVYFFKVLDIFFLMIRRPPRSTQSRSSAASDVYKRQVYLNEDSNQSNRAK